MYIQLLPLFLALSYVFPAKAADLTQCPITRYGLAREDIPEFFNNSFGTSCVCAEDLQRIKAPTVEKMKLAAACSVSHNDNGQSGAFFYVGKVKLLGLMKRDWTTNWDPDTDTSVFFQIKNYRENGWPDSFYFHVYPRVENIPEPTTGSLCWQADAAIEVQVALKTVNVKYLDKEGYANKMNGFSVLRLSPLHVKPAQKCN